MEPADDGGAAVRPDPSGRALHARLLQRDPIASSDLATSYLEPLLARLQRAYPRQDSDMLSDIASELILDLPQRPEQYDPDRLSLPAYLLMAAKRDVLNAIQREQRRLQRIAPLEAVELRPPARNNEYAPAADPADVVARAAADADVAQELAGLSDTDREVVQLMMDGERRYAVFAGVLGLRGRPDAEQRREVKRAKDRLKKWLQRSRRRNTVDA